ncbi:hypothetical protein IW261DRAFT_1564767 [Armillaria novae-zelandiae]|uniref:Uncharacterized protein n=1 Tax=Armillaria novae-zelandiae TaxID=153914 RepID=A0AA39P6W7_9AGAR|nr:hypothetical protein IW261DRAFT_1564767 [Armillaria novae-zelandiae]
MSGPEDMGTKDAVQGGKSKEKEVPTIIITDSESMPSQKSEEPVKKKIAMAFKAAGPVQKKKEKTKAPLVDKTGDVNRPSERKKEKTKALPISEEATKGDINRHYFKAIDGMTTVRLVVRKPAFTSYQNVQHRDHKLLDGHRFWKPHGLQPHLHPCLAVGITKLGRFNEAHHCNGGLVECGATKATEFGGNHSLSLFGIIRSAARDKKVYPKAEISPISFYDRSGEDGSQEEMVAPEVVDRGEGSSRGQTTLGMTEDDDEEYYDDED